jgi:hypothetical protein
VRVSARLELHDQVALGDDTLLALDITWPQGIDVMLLNRSAAQLGEVALAAGWRPFDAATARPPDVVVVVIAQTEDAQIPSVVFDWASQGHGVLLLAEGSAPAAAVGQALAGLGLLQFDGMVGPQWCSWTGSWYLVKPHPVFDGLPTAQCMGRFYQADPRGADGRWMDLPSMQHFADGLCVHGAGVETLVAYGRDHTARMGAAMAVLPCGTGRILVSSMAGLAPSLGGDFRGFQPLSARRIVANALRFLAAGPGQPTAKVP